MLTRGSAVGHLTYLLYGWLTRVGIAVGVSGCLIALPVSAAGPLRPSEVAAEAAALASHEASYDMRLTAVRSSAGVVGAGGTMNYTFTNGCDGWTVETRTELTLLESQGGPVQTSWDFLSWEDKNGRSYRFRVRNLRNGQVVESYDGEARLSESGRGTAVFHFPEEPDQEFELPVGTRFPTSHTLELLHRAKKGGRFYAVPIFDGSAVQGAFQVSAGMAASIPGRPVDPALVAALPELPATVDPSLLRMPSWPMTLAFFDLDGAGDTPDFEVGLRYHENGVAEDILQDFGDFALRGSLTKLKALKKPEC